MPKVLLRHLNDDIPKVSSRHLASNPDQYRWRGWRLHKGGAYSIASNRPLKLHAIQWRSKNDNLIPRQVDKTQIVPTAGNAFRLRRQWGVKCVGGRVQRMRWNRGFKWESDWIRRYGGGQRWPGWSPGWLLSRDFRFGSSPLWLWGSHYYNIMNYINYLN